MTSGYANDGDNDSVGRSWDDCGGGMRSMMEWWWWWGDVNDEMMMVGHNDVRDRGGSGGR